MPWSFILEEAFSEKPLFPDCLPTYIRIDRGKSNWYEDTLGFIVKTSKKRTQIVLI